MIPIGDSVRSRTFPYVNLAIIIANFLVFFYELSLGNEVNQFLRDWGVVPRLITDYFDHAGDHPLRVLFTPITAMFIHGGWFHILGNMIFLWVFGDNVEDAMGHVGYLFFYLLAGIAAATAQIWVDSSSYLPMVGASHRWRAGGLRRPLPAGHHRRRHLPLLLLDGLRPRVRPYRAVVLPPASLRRGGHWHSGGRQRGGGLVGAHRGLPGGAAAGVGVPRPPAHAPRPSH